jgi:uncharacterized protein (TIGR02145 family)
MWSGLSTVAFAQVEVCTNTSYTINSTVDASGVTTYRWSENGKVMDGANAATYAVPSGKASAGLYTYIRQAKSVDCDEWQSSNEFTVTVFDCSFSAGTETSATATFVDPRDGKSYKTVVMPDGRTWFAQNLNYTKDLTFNTYAYEANGKPFVTMHGSEYASVSSAPAIGSYWCPGVSESVESDRSTCDIYGPLYTWETAMMVDGKYADETKTSSAWDESWMSGNNYNSGAPGVTPNADKNNARGGTSVKGGGRGICPMGWHVPTFREWAIMLDAVDGSQTFTLTPLSRTWLGTDVGLKLKSSGTYTGADPGDGRWVDNQNRGNNSTGFAVLPAGLRGWYQMAFANRGTAAALITSSYAGAFGILTLELNSAVSNVYVVEGRGAGTAVSVRCLKDD